MEYRTGETFTCAVTNSLPFSTWSVWKGQSTKYQFYGICGKKYTQPVNKSDLDAACDKAFQRCSTNYDTQCARDSIIGLYFTITQFK